MLGGLINRLSGATRRRRTPTPGGPVPGRPAGRGTAAPANREVERGARMLLRGLRRRR